MKNKSIIAIAAASTVSIMVALNFLQFHENPTLKDSETVAMAPLSLGNPAAAATLQTRNIIKPAEERLPKALPATYTQQIEVGKGDTLAELLIGAGVDRTDAHYAIEAMSEYFSPRRIRRGQEVTLTFQSAPLLIDVKAGGADQDGHDKFMGFSIEPDYKTEVRITRNLDGGFKAEERAKVLNRVPVRAAGTIENSLYVSGRDKGVPAVVIARLIRLLSWDVDFQRDIREGDGFEVMYERVFDRNGKPVYDGAVKYAALTLSGKRISLYRYEFEDGTVDYFDETGKASRKALMRTPIDGARLSSTFGARKHPILGFTRMHKGVDFAAPTGTPIYAAGNGTVVYAGPKGGYGNYVRLHHNGTFDTAYAHMKAFARGVRSGARVEQGQIIGYVGTTGRSTGPHLHYEVLQNNAQVNPLKVKMPSGKTLTGMELARFQKVRADQDKLFASLSTDPAPEVAAIPKSD